MKHPTYHETIERLISEAIKQDEILKGLKTYLVNYVLSLPIKGIIKLSGEFTIDEIQDDEIMSAVKKDIAKRENEIISFYKPTIQNETDKNA